MKKARQRKTNLKKDLKKEEKVQRHMGVWAILCIYWASIVCTLVYTNVEIFMSSIY